jgi:hypothetical protein
MWCSPYLDNWCRIGAGGWLSRDSFSGLATEESLSLQSSKAFCSGSTAYLINCLGVLRVLCPRLWSRLYRFVEGFDF